MIAPRFIAAFSGHRELHHPKIVEDALNGVFEELKQRAHERGGELEIFSSIAYGADTLAVETARAAGFTVHLILPKPVRHEKDDDPSTPVLREEGFAADFWDDATATTSRAFRTKDWDRSYQQIQDAQAGVNGATFRLTHGSQSQPDCYYDAGLETLECADVLVAVFDKQHVGGLGGTQDVVEFARKLELAMVLIDANTGAIERERLDQFAYEKDEGCKLIREADDCSREFDVAGAGARANSGQIFKRLSACSNERAREFRYGLVWIIVLHGLATSVAAVACILPHEPMLAKVVLAGLALLELVLIVYAGLLSRKLHQREVHRSWIQARFGAEILQAISDSENLLDPLQPLVARHDPRWRRFATTLGLMIHRENQPLPPWQAARDKYLQKRLRDPDPRNHGQIIYFTTKQIGAEKVFRKTVWAGRYLTRWAVAFVFGACLYKGWVVFGSIGESPAEPFEPTHGHPVLATIVALCFRLAPIVLPLAAGVVISLRAALDSGRRTYRYREVAEFFEDSASKLEALHTYASVCRGVAIIEEVLVDELVEWRLAEQQNGAH